MIYYLQLQEYDMFVAGLKAANQAMSTVPAPALNDSLSDGDEPKSKRYAVAECCVY